MIVRVHPEIEEKKEGRYKWTVVWAVWDEPKVDVPYRFGWAVDYREKKLIRRIKKCVKEQEAFGPVEIAYDVYDRSYIKVTPRLRKETLHEDLKRLGY